MPVLALLAAILTVLVVSVTPSAPELSLTSFVEAPACNNQGVLGSPTITDTGQDSDTACTNPNETQQKCDRVRTESVNDDATCTPHPDFCCLPYTYYQRTYNWKCKKDDATAPCKCCYTLTQGPSGTMLGEVGCTAANLCDGEPSQGGAPAGTTACGPSSTDC